LKYARLELLGIYNRGKIDANEVIVSSIYDKHKFLKVDIADTEKMYKLFEKENFDAVCDFSTQAGVRYSLENLHAYI
jgi:UDP-glucuronate 4-epimerase